MSKKRIRLSLLFGDHCGAGWNDMPTPRLDSFFPGRKIRLAGSLISEQARRLARLTRNFFAEGYEASDERIEFIHRKLSAAQRPKNRPIWNCIAAGREQLRLACLERLIEQRRHRDPCLDFARTQCTQR